MELSKRKKKILKVVIDDYIETAIPVSSKSIASKYMTDISSATVRSEMSALEELGYLSQLHTSSGRVPSKEAYKLYVTDLMQTNELSVKELDYIKKIFLEKSDKLEDIIRSATKVISELTSYTSLGVSSFEAKEHIESIKLIRIKSDKALVLIVTDTKLFKDNIIDVNENMQDENLEDANTLLTNMFVGKTFEEVCTSMPELDDDFLSYKSIFINVIEALKVYLTSNEQSVTTAGEDMIFNHPEYASIDKIKDFLSVVTKKDKVYSLLTDDDRNVDINIKIGADGYNEIPTDCSLVTAQYSVNGQKIGTYGVLGPIRMDYKKVVAVLENVGKILESIITNK